MRRERGFTLVELLVVFAILALLVGLIPVAFDRFRDSAQYRDTVRTMLSHLFNVFIFVGIRFYVRGINKDGIGLNKAAFNCLHQDTYEYLLEQIAFFKTTLVVFTKGGEVRDLFLQPIAKKPAVSYIDLNVLDGLTH